MHTFLTIILVLNCVATGGILGISLAKGSFENWKYLLGGAVNTVVIIYLIEVFK